MNFSSKTFLVLFLTLNLISNTFGDEINYTNNHRIKILLNSTSNLFDYLSNNTNISEEVHVLLIKIAGFKSINEYNSFVSKNNFAGIKTINPPSIALVKAERLYQILSEKFSKLEWFMEKTRLNNGILDIGDREEADKIISLLETLRNLDSFCWFEYLTFHRSPFRMYTENFDIIVNTNLPPITH